MNGNEFLHREGICWRGVDCITDILSLFSGKRKRRGLADYEIGRCLGSGGFGEVFAATRKRDNLPVSKTNVFMKFEHLLDITCSLEQNPFKLLSANI